MYFMICNLVNITKNNFIFYNKFFYKYLVIITKHLVMLLCSVIPTKYLKSIRIIFNYINRTLEIILLNI